MSLDLGVTGLFEHKYGAPPMYKESFAVGELFPSTPSDIAIETVSRRGRLAGLAGTAVALLVLFVAAREYRNLDFATLRDALPVAPAFWVAFGLFYLAGPLGDWLIYRRLWRVPFEGFLALIRKMVSNELVLGYLGEAQFYAWARNRVDMAAAPFGAIKDVALLSALVGNLATLLLLAFAWPLITAHGIGIEMHGAFMSLGIVLVTSFAMLLLRRKLFTLPQPQLRFIAGIHAGRTVASILLAALCWHLALPGIALALWLAMSALRMLVTRLPFVPNKELVFASLVVLLLGHEPRVGALMTVMAALTLLAHAFLGTLFAVAHIAPWRGVR
jgi:hypothetical protein